MCVAREPRNNELIDPVYRKTDIITTLPAIGLGSIFFSRGTMKFNAIDQKLDKLNASRAKCRLVRVFEVSLNIRRDEMVIGFGIFFNFELEKIALSFCAELF